MLRPPNGIGTEIPEVDGAGFPVRSTAAVVLAGPTCGSSGRPPTPSSKAYFDSGLALVADRDEDARSVDEGREKRGKLPVNILQRSIAGKQQRCAPHEISRLLQALVSLRRRNSFRHAVLILHRRNVAPKTTLPLAKRNSG
jgi:hypothetical protein